MFDATRRPAHKRDGCVPLHHHRLARVAVKRLRDSLYPPSPRGRRCAESPRQPRKQAPQLDIERRASSLGWRRAGAPASADPLAEWVWTPPPSPAAPSHEPSGISVSCHSCHSQYALQGASSRPQRTHGGQAVASAHDTPPLSGDRHLVDQPPKARSGGEAARHPAVVIDADCRMPLRRTLEWKRAAQDDPCVLYLVVSWL
jgi:hypothetical protein